MSEFDPGSIRALVFDVFGTVVDWRGTIIGEGEALSAAMPSAKAIRTIAIRPPARPAG